LLSLAPAAQVVQALTVLKNGIPAEAERVPVVVSLFICEALHVMLQPDHVLYAVDGIPRRACRLLDEKNRRLVLSQTHTPPGTSR
jgi:hypothetical protein